MGPTNKLLADLGEQTMIRRVVDAVLSSRVARVVVVTGHERERVEAELQGLALEMVFNPAFREGLASTLRCGLESLSAAVPAALIVLGDMPRVTSAHIDQLLSAYLARKEDGIFVPTYAGRRGNPVLFARCYFAELAGICGDTGGRQLLRAHNEKVCEVPMNDDAVLIDVDDQHVLAEIVR